MTITLALYSQKYNFPEKLEFWKFKIGDKVETSFVSDAIFGVSCPH